MKSLFDEHHTKHNLSISKRQFREDDGTTGDLRETHYSLLKRAPKTCGGNDGTDFLLFCLNFEKVAMFCWKNTGQQQWL